MNQIIVRVIDEFFKREIQRPWEIPYRNKPVFTFAVSAPSAPSVSNILLLDRSLQNFRDSAFRELLPLQTEH